MARGRSIRGDRGDGDLLQWFFKEIRSVRHDERLLIVVTHGILELFVNTLVDVRCKHGKTISSDNRGYPQGAKLIILHEIGALSDTEFEYCDAFRSLRNKAAHEPLFRLEEPDLVRFPLKWQHPAALSDLCFELVGLVWNNHVKELVPRFSPNILANRDSEEPK